ncbi:MAG: GTPase HflX [Deltaproteobacteria bacterium]|nr:GTPase HflX [Deltaproteobacteria bacterium]
MATVTGNTLGLKKDQLRRLDHLYRRRMVRAEVFSADLARQMSAISREIGRQVAVLVGRDGRIGSVLVGNAHRMDLPDNRRERRSGSRLSGQRLVHTHLAGEGLSQEDLVALAVHRLDLVASIDAEGDGEPGTVRIAHLLPAGGAAPHRVLEFPSPDRTEFDCGWEIESLEAELSRTAERGREVSGRERALLIGLSTGHDGLDHEPIVAEIRELARTAGVDVADVVWQRRREPDPKYLIGKGKLDAITTSAMRSDVDFLLFASDLSPAQARSIEDATGYQIIDRTQLILDIFARRARSRDGKLQVELAQMKYLLPRLTEKDTGLSRHTGGIGLRGPGETKLEIGRRRARERIARLEAGIRELSRQRELRRSKRREAGLPVISIVGYTNAGKSTLLNTLTKSAVHVEDKLFATLDPSSRRLRFPEDRDAVVTDTVGFIRDLPKDLVAAFRATLEELSEADLLLHVVDCALPGFEDRMEAVSRILADLGLDGIPQVLVFNKVDALDAALAAALSRQHRAIPISAETGAGLGELVAACDRALFSEKRRRKPVDREQWTAGGEE